VKQGEKGNGRIRNGNFREKYAAVAVVILLLLFLKMMHLT